MWIFFSCCLAKKTNQQQITSPSPGVHRGAHQDKVVLLYKDHMIHTACSTPAALYLSHQENKHLRNVTDL